MPIAKPKSENAKKIESSRKRMHIQNTIVKMFGASSPIDLDAPQNALAIRSA
jgi:hypothetical protein